MSEASGAYSEHTYKDRWGDDGPEVKVTITYDASQPERALAALDKVYDAMRENIDAGARSYAAHAAEVSR